MSTPYWQLRAPYWQLSDFRDERRPRIEQKVEIYRAVPASPDLLERAEAASTLEMKFAIFNRWQEISDAQGRYLERIAPGAFAKTIRESLASIRAILSHGKDPSLGSTVLGKVESIREQADGAIARVSLFRSVPQLLVDGLRAGVYGSSFRGAPIKSKTDYRPARSASNPEGIPEVTRLEIALKDVGPTPFAAYEGTTALLGSAMGEGLPARARPSWQLGDPEETHGRVHSLAN